MFERTRFSSIVRPALLGLCVLIGTSAVSDAAPILVDFDSPNASGTSVTGASLDLYLAGFGISISNVSPSGYPEIHDANSSGFPSGFLTPASGSNLFSHGDGIAGGGANASTNSPISYQLDFSTLLNSVSFTRIQINASTSPSGAVVAEWSARALDGLGSTIDTAGEGQLASFGTIPSATFTLNGPGIASLVIERTSTNLSAGVNTALLDDLVLDPVPEPTTALLVGMGLVCMAAKRRRAETRP